MLFGKFSSGGAQRADAAWWPVVALTAVLAASCGGDAMDPGPRRPMGMCDPACQNGGTCIGTTCDCLLTDFGGPSCEERVDDCAGVDCLNGGMCVDGNRSFSCDCVAPWAPDAETSLCTVQVVDCATTNPCLNGGACTDVAPGEVTCDCASTGFEGDNCQTDIDECALNTDTCDDTGTAACANTPGSFTCMCNVGFMGDNCDTCAAGHEGVDCSTCAEGYVASTVTPGACILDPCAGNSCLDGVCEVDGADMALCRCEDGAQNSDETDVDCGGMTCTARCTEGQRCMVDGDCGNNMCVLGPDGMGGMALMCAITL